MKLRQSLAGKDGVKEVTYKVEYTDGVETAREKISEKTVTEATPKVVRLGTKKEKEADEAIASRVYFNNSQNWNKVYAYVYDSQGKPVVGTWPGDKKCPKMSMDIILSYQKTCLAGKSFSTIQIPRFNIQPKTKQAMIWELQVTSMTLMGNTKQFYQRKEVTRITLTTQEVGMRRMSMLIMAIHQMPLGAWPGKAMTKDNQGNFYIDLPKTYADSNVKILLQQTK